VNVQSNDESQEGQPNETKYETFTIVLQSQLIDGSLFRSKERGCIKLELSHDSRIVSELIQNNEELVQSDSNDSQTKWERKEQTQHMQDRKKSEMKKPPIAKKYRRLVTLRLSANGAMNA
jgi:hypothetical protein